MPIMFNCPVCSHRLKVPDDAGGKRGKFPACGVRVAIPYESEDSKDIPIPLDAAAVTSANPPASFNPSPIPQGKDSDMDLVIPPSAIVSTSIPSQSPPRLHALQPQNTPIRVVVVDFDMKFMSMVNFMTKWVLATIPAFLVLFFLGMVLALVVTVIGHLLTPR
jgi:hypothetical protein